MKKSTIILMSILMVFVGICLSVNSAIAGEENPDKPVVLTDANEAP